MEQPHCGTVQGQQVRHSRPAVALGRSLLRPRHPSGTPQGPEVPYFLPLHGRALSKPSMFGNIFIISVSLIVIMSFSPPPLTRSYGICHYGLHINHDHLLWNTPLDLAKLFGVICYSAGRGRDRPHLLQHHEGTPQVHLRSGGVRYHRRAGLHVARRARRYELLHGPQWALAVTLTCRGHRVARHLQHRSQVRRVHRLLRLCLLRRLLLLPRRRVPRHPRPRERHQAV